MHDDEHKSGTRDQRPEITYPSEVGDELAVKAGFDAENGRQNVADFPLVRRALVSKVVHAHGHCSSRTVLNGPTHINHVHLQTVGGGWEELMGTVLHSIRPSTRWDHDEPAG